MHVGIMGHFRGQVKVGFGLSQDETHQAQGTPGWQGLFFFALSGAGIVIS
ncbi:MAG: hypothetical protein GY809_02675 [Planctomycetes bacterium]|nr:hypothetical protein [Planctomycetota bacterium]